MHFQIHMQAFVRPFECPRGETWEGLVRWQAESVETATMLHGKHRLQLCEQTPNAANATDQNSVPHMWIVHVHVLVHFRGIGDLPKVAQSHTCHGQRLLSHQQQLILPVVLGALKSDRATEGRLRGSG